MKPCMKPCSIGDTGQALVSRNRLIAAGFGKVFQAMVNLTPVAIKVLDHEGLQGIREFHNEVWDLPVLTYHGTTLTRVHPSPVQKFTPHISASRFDFWRESAILMSYVC